MENKQQKKELAEKSNEEPKNETLSQSILSSILAIAENTNFEKGAVKNVFNIFQKNDVPKV